MIYIAASTLLTRHALAAERACVALVPIKSSPDLGWLYLGLHFGLVLWLGLDDLLPPAFDLPAAWPALFLFSSYLYLHTFAVPEQGAPFAGAYALIAGQAWLGGRRMLCLGDRADARRHTPGLWRSLGLLLLLLALSAVRSMDPGASLERALQIAVLAGLPFLFACEVGGTRRWRLAAAWAVGLGGVLLVGLAGLKLVVVARELGWVPALRHRLYIDEIGPNWVARPLVSLLPLAAGLLLTAPGRAQKALWGAALAGMLLALAYSQSDQGAGGWLGLALGGGSLGLLLGWPALARGWRRARRARWPAAAGALAVLVALVAAGIWLSARLNACSFSGRLYVWRVALRQVADRPLAGSGLGVRYMASFYSAPVSWEEMGPRTQWFQDRPLSRWWQKRQTQVHTHNLLLELAAGGGVPVALAFAWFLWELGRQGLALWARLQGETRILAAACLAGLVGALGWGVLDVLEFSPPFFSYPAWALIGLLLAAPGETERPRSPLGIRLPGRGTGPAPGRGRGAAWRWLSMGGALAALLLIAALLLGNLHYRRAYTAYQEGRWPAAVDELARASRWEPLNAKYEQLSAQALINLDRYPEAIAAYERAARLRRGYAPYLAQLGWLHWLQGDLERATDYLEQAVEMDPREAWREGAHAELGLAYVAQGRVEEAVPLFAATLELDPQMALAPYWVPRQGADGRYEVVLDGAYQGASGEARAAPDALRPRILGHLGRADYTPQRYAPVVSPEATLSMERVLAEIEAHYERAREAEPRLAPRLLATVAEAARLSGKHARAERAYRAFQAAYPSSAYGWRDLALLYREQGRLEEARLLLEQAVAVSPKNVDSWVELAGTALDLGLDGQAQEALDAVYRLESLDPRLYVLRARTYAGRGETEQAALALRRSLALEESVTNRLSLAQLYRQAGDARSAQEQCREAAGALLRAWPPPLDPALWEVGVCLAETRQGRPLDLEGLVEGYPLAGGVLEGHVYRALGQLERALEAYRAVAQAYPAQGAPVYLLGETYQALGQVEEAERHYREAAQLSPLDAQPLLALGRLLEQGGDPQAAQDAFRTATARAPGWSQARLVLGNALLRAGDQAGAAEQYRLAQIVERDLDEGWGYDLGAKLAEAEVEAPGPAYVRADVLNVGGEARRALLEHPPSRIRYRLTLAEDAALTFEVGTAPESWEQPGDGVTFAVHVTPAEGAEMLWSVYLDPKRDPGARRWQRHTLDLSAYGGQVVDLTLETGPGPAGDERFDWAAWGEPRLVRRPAAPGPGANH